MNQKGMISIDEVAKEMDRLIELCTNQSALFKESNMPSSELCSQAMATAYKKVKEFVNSKLK